MPHCLIYSCQVHFIACNRTFVVVVVCVKMAVFDAKFVPKKKHTRVVHAIMKLENHYSPQPSTMAAEAIFVPSNTHSQYAHLISQKFDVNVTVYAPKKGDCSENKISFSACNSMHSNSSFFQLGALKIKLKAISVSATILRFILENKTMAFRYNYL